MPQDEIDDDALLAAAEQVEAETKPVKRKRESSPSKEKKSTLQRNDEGDIYFQLSGKKRITVRKWKSNVLIDIREFWTDKNDGKDKPGKKGISLSSDQWNALKAMVADIDSAIDQA